VITTAVLSANPPLLFRELTGQEDVAAPLRSAAVSALRVPLAGEAVVTVVGPDETSREWDSETPVDVRRWGTTGARTSHGLPLSLGVGRRLLDEAGWTGQARMRTLAYDATDAEVDETASSCDGVVLLLGDGSTRRGNGAPGFLDERAFPFDDAVATALAAGDASALRRLDVRLAEELMVLGRSSFRLLGAFGRPERMELSYRDDPFGVSYFVARWGFTVSR